jgi:hypothetical protein
MATLSRLSIAFCALSLSGCMTFTVEGFGTRTPDAQHGKETSHGSIYGFSWSTTNAEKCTDSNQLYRVRFHTNMAYLAAGVMSFGFYVPQTIEWWCTEQMAEEPPEEALYNPND